MIYVDVLGPGSISRSWTCSRFMGLKSHTLGATGDGISSLCGSRPYLRRVRRNRVSRTEQLEQAGRFESPAVDVEIRETGKMLKSLPISHFCLHSAIQPLAPNHWKDTCC